MFRLIKLLIWISLISGGILFWQYSDFSKREITLTSQVYEVQPGETFTSILEKETGNSLFSKLYLRNNPPSISLNAGKYSFSGSYSIDDFLLGFQRALNEDEQVTILEGWNIYDIDKELTRKGLIQSGEYISYTTACEGFCELKKDFAFVANAETLEGFLYPDTYNINPENFQVSNLVRSQLRNFQKKVIDSGIISDMGSIEILDVVNLASIVQKEANKADNPEELAIIAGILKKRLDEGWQIGADATICYPYKIATQDCGPEEVLRYLYKKNEYNTRQMTGLPRTAIANPEAEVIEATVNYQVSPYYYYLHDNSGQIHYGITDADHNRNKNTYLN